MINTFVHIARASNPSYQGFTWWCVGPYITTLFDKLTPPSLDWGIELVSPYVPWHSVLIDNNAVTGWVATTLAIPYTEEVGQNVINTLLQISFIDSL